MNYADIPGMNWSSLKAMATSPFLYQWRTTHLRPDTAAFRLGRAIHCAVLEPDEFVRRYAEYPGKTRRGKQWENWRDTHPGVESLTPAERAVVDVCTAHLKAHPDAARLLSGGRTEETVTWTDEPTSTACKGRVDFIAPTRLVDLKTCGELAWFQRDFSRYLYHGQMAWYFDGAVAARALPEDAVVHVVVVETAEPYDVGVFSVPALILAPGRRLYRRLLDLWVECSETGLWPGQCPAPRMIELELWAEGNDEAIAEVW